MVTFDEFDWARTGVVGGVGPVQLRVFGGLSARPGDSLARCAAPSLEPRKRSQGRSVHRTARNNIPASGTGSHLLRSGGGIKIGAPHKPSELSGGATFFPPGIHRRRKPKMLRENGGRGRSLQINAA